jgi:hypothetical protein
MKLSSLRALTLAGLVFSLVLFSSSASLLFADTDAADEASTSKETSPVSTTAVDTEKPTPVVSSTSSAPAVNEVAKTAAPSESSVPTSASYSEEASTSSAKDVSYQLRLKPSISAPVILTLSESELKSSAQDTGIVEGGLRWMSIERPVNLVGYVDKVSVDKDLTINSGAIVWATPEKKSQLTVIDNPAYAQLLEVDQMAKVQVKEPRVLYYGLPISSSAATRAQAYSNASSSSASSQSTNTSPADKNLENAAKRRGSAVNIPQSNVRAIQATLRKGNPLLGGKLFLVDQNGHHICNIDPQSPIGAESFKGYIGRSAVFSGVLNETRSGLVLSVRSIRLR